MRAAAIGAGAISARPEKTSCITILRFTVLRFRKAENPNAAVALEACITYLRQSQEGQKTRIDKYKNEFHFTDLNIQQLYETQKVGVPVLDLAPFLGEGAFYDVICNSVSWLTALANDEPKVQEKLESMFRTSIQ